MDPRSILKRLHDDSADLVDENIDVTDDNEEVVILRPVVDAADDDDDLDEDEEDLTDARKKRVKDGKVVMMTAEQVREKEKPGKSRNQTPAQYRAALRNIRKARRKSNNPAAKRKRAKSNKIRAARGMDSVADLININELNDMLHEAICDAFAQKLSLNDDQVNDLVGIVVDGIEASFDGEGIVLEFPKLQSTSDGVDLSEAEFHSVRFDLDDGATAEDAVAYIMGHFDLMSRML